MAMGTQAFLYPNSELGLAEAVFELKKRTTTVGRHPSNDISLLLESVSRFHARLEDHDTGWFISDLKSSNGTFVNGERVTEARAVNSGDVITFGRADFRFSTHALGEAEFRAEDSTKPVSMSKTSTSSVNIVGDDQSPSLILSTKLNVDATPLPSPAMFAEEVDVEALRKANDRLLTLYKLTEVIRSSLTRDEVLHNVMKLLFEVLPCDRGVILTLETPDGQFEPQVVRFRDPSKGNDLTISRTILQKCRNDRAAILSRDTKIDRRFSTSESIMASDIRSAMCVPLISKKKLMGVLFVDTSESVRSFSEEDLTFVSSLANDLALTLDNLNLAEENIKNERLAAVGQTIAGLAHNIKNILQLAKGGLELMDGAITKKKPEEVEAYWPVVRRGIERMQSLTQEMLEYSRQTRPELKDVSVNQVIQDTVSSFEKDSMDPGVMLDVQLTENLPSRKIDPDGLFKSLMNLIGNAKDAFDGAGGNITVSTSREENTIFIRVQDNGKGIPKDKRVRIFQPFFTTKGSKGTGLGLSMTRKYIEDMGGTISVDSEEGRGTTFTITLAPLTTEMRFDVQPEQAAATRME